VSQGDCTPARTQPSWRVLASSLPSHLLSATAPWFPQLLYEATSSGSGLLVGGCEADMASESTSMAPRTYASAEPPQAYRDGTLSIGVRVRHRRPPRKPRVRSGLGALAVLLPPFAFREARALPHRPRGALALRRAAKRTAARLIENVKCANQYGRREGWHTCIGPEFRVRRFR